MKDYCAAFANVPQNVAAFKAFMTRHDISGIQATDARR
jgi:hypothetical protein